MTNKDTVMFSSTTCGNKSPSGIFVSTSISPNRGEVTLLGIIATALDGPTTALKMIAIGSTRANTAFRGAGNALDVKADHSSIDHKSETLDDCIGAKSAPKGSA